MIESMTRLHRYKHRKTQKTLIVKRAVKPQLVDRLVYLAAIVEPLLTLPQAILVYRQKSAADISILSWIGFEIMTLIWLWYAVVHKERMIFIYQGLFLIVDGSILVAAMLYGGRLI